MYHIKSVSSWLSGTTDNLHHQYNLLSSIGYTVIGTGAIIVKTTRNDSTIVFTLNLYYNNYISIFGRRYNNLFIVQLNELFHFITITFFLPSTPTNSSLPKKKIKIKKNIKTHTSL